LRLITKVILSLLVALITTVVLWLPYPQIGTLGVASYLAWILPGGYIALFIRVEIEKGEESPTRSRRLLFREYKVLNESVGRRENSLLVAGSIFVTASLLLLGQSTQVSEGALRQSLVFTSWAVYSIWLYLFQLTAGRLTDRTFDRLRDIEGRLGIKVHRYLASKRDPVRRWVWLWLLNGLLVAGSLVIGLDLLVFKVALPFEVLLMAVPSFKKKKEESDP
jgi:hypothetical protein